ncbi:hypothetical protein WA026_023382 [Henosepilachna vigintioctopunctata]|uniref:RecQ-mediated genome instability protein 1 n=1 Tax=Henosepilachna vigintioctopunctata TaxID=420089 RepID=A0AAW1UYQ9_9CUCU
MQQSEIQRIKSTFDNNNIPVSLEWLEECVAWCKGEVLGASYTIDQLKNATHDQWLLLDLRDIESPVLPPGLSEKKYMVLNGNFSLQVMQVVDISKPKYWQIQQIRKENILTKPQRNESNDSVGTGKRVLQLSLTDGVQYVEAIEYKPITVLDINLTPGIKVRLSGPITIRRGRLMLQEKNIRILGGEVESLLVSNAAENILAKALKLPENPDPQVVDVNLLSVDQEDGSNTQQTSSSNQNPDCWNKISTHYEEEIELLMEVEREFDGNKKNNTKNIRNKTPDLFEDDFNLDQIDHLVEVTNKIENKQSKNNYNKKESVQMEKNTAVESR